MRPSDEMADAISQAVLGNPYDKTSTLPERFMIDFLCEQLEDWEQGSNDTQNLLATFDQHDTGNFDIRAFINEKVQQGQYVWPEDAP